MVKQPDSDVRQLPDEETIAKLLEIAGPSPEIPPDTVKRVYGHVLQAWQSGTERPDPARIYDRVLQTWHKNRAWSERRRWMLPLGATAAAVLAFLLLAPPEPAPRIVVASVNKVVGTQTDSDRAGPGENIYAGETLTTAAGEGISLLFARSESVRLDGDSRIRVDAKDRLTLLRGRVYADTGEFVYRDSGLTIVTALGSVQDVGTQFAVAVDGELLDVAVREGRVDIQRDQHEHVVVAGERLLLTDDGRSEIVPIAKNADYWSWVSDLALNIDIENKSLLDFLKWVSRETGMELVFESDEVLASAMRTDLHGSIRDFTPHEALQSILATTAFQYRIEADRIVIER
jgi:ferric-dicitrate binding protein FerR (iron transport regulator)